jgi:hypothetical protein
MKGNSGTRSPSGKILPRSTLDSTPEDLSLLVAPLNPATHHIDLTHITTESTDGSLHCATKSRDSWTNYLHVVRWSRDGKPLRARIDTVDDLKTMAFLDPTLGHLSGSSSSVGGATTLIIDQPATMDPHATVVKLVLGIPGVD